MVLRYVFCMFSFDNLSGYLDWGNYFGISIDVWNGQSVELKFFWKTFSNISGDLDSWKEDSGDKSRPMKASAFASEDPAPYKPMAISCKYKIPAQNNNLRTIFIMSSDCQSLCSGFILHIICTGVLFKIFLTFSNSLLKYLFPWTGPGTVSLNRSSHLPMILMGSL